jgi:hypothetical protein
LLRHGPSGPSWLARPFLQRHQQPGQALLQRHLLVRHRRVVGGVDVREGGVAAHRPAAALLAPLVARRLSGRADGQREEDGPEVVAVVQAGEAPLPHAAEEALEGDDRHVLLVRDAPGARAQPPPGQLQHALGEAFPQRGGRLGRLGLQLPKQPGDGAGLGRHRDGSLPGLAEGRRGRPATPGPRGEAGPGIRD